MYVIVRIGGAILAVRVAFTGPPLPPPRGSLRAGQRPRSLPRLRGTGGKEEGREGGGRMEVHLHSYSAAPDESRYGLREFHRRNYRPAPTPAAGAVAPFIRAARVSVATYVKGGKCPDLINRRLILTLSDRPSLYLRRERE